MNERSIFIEALDKTNAAQRAAYLDAVCGEDVLMRRRIEKLLSAHEAAGGILDHPAVAEDATGPHQPITEGSGTVIGPYKLLQKIGEGGFGVVFMAEQQQPVRRTVALKIIKPGMDTAQVIARFESERQALALMDHPNIAKVLDAGATSEVRKQSFSRDAESSERSDPSPALTPDSSVLTPDCGRPYFVMELVKGIPITEFCDKNHLPPEHRLKLFIDVCHAIQHAHHKGVIHRDVKPSNVMVTLHDGVPVVKVIDFGVAKATVQKLTERTLFTAYGQMIGTPAYMSPEQAEMSGLDIDTRSDVYSLGVLLYELLTGTTPLESKRLREAGYSEMQRLIREEEAPRPSNRLSSLGDSATVLAGNRGLDVRRLVQMLAGDLDWIVMKALEKDRNRRYGTPVNFAEDIQRYLRNDPIEARPPSASYRLRKFVRRNKARVFAATALMFVLLAGLAGTTVGLLHARREAERACQAENRTTDLLGDVTNQKDRAERNLRLLSYALSPLQREADDPTWYLLFNGYVYNEVEGEDSEQAMRKRIADTEAAVRDLPADLTSDVQLRLTLALHYLKYGATLMNPEDDPRSYIPWFDKAIRVLEREIGGTPSFQDSPNVIALQIAYVARARAFVDLERYREAQADYRRAIEVHDPPEDPEIRLEYVGTLISLEKYDGAAHQLEQCLSSAKMQSEKTYEMGEIAAELSVQLAPDPRRSERFATLAAKLFRRAVQQGFPAKKVIEKLKKDGNWSSLRSRTGVQRLIGELERQGASPE